MKYWVGGLFITLFISAPLFAQNEKWWVIIQKDSQGVTWLGDSESIRPSSENSPSKKIVWFHKYFPEVIEGMKSAKLQWYVDCGERTWRQLEFIDYDVSYMILGSGDLDEEDKPVISGNISETMFQFVCNTPSYRKSNFLEIGADVDYRGVAEFFNDSREIVAEGASPKGSAAAPMPSPAISSEVPSSASKLSPFYHRYRTCAISSARTFSKSKENAPVVAASAIQNCEQHRSEIDKAMNENGYSFERRKFLLDKIDIRIRSEAQLEVIKIRSK